MKRAVFCLCVAVPWLQAVAVSACPADPGESSVLLASAPAFPCRWVFRLDGGRDELRINVTLKDAAGNLLPDCEVTAEFVPLVGTAFACDAVQTMTSDSEGNASFLYSKAGGCGAFEIVVSSGAIVLDTLGPYPMTSPDLNGDGVTNVVDLGLWAGCLPNGCPCADYNCDSVVNIIDLGVWAGGLGGIC